MPEYADEPRDILAAEEFGVPAPDPALGKTEAHDVLAAEEFGMPAPDPRLQEREARDVLAAEEFGVPAPDPVLKVVAGGVTLPLPRDPADPAGSLPAHDVLAAEEFAVPGPPPHALPPDFSAPQSRSTGYGRLAYGAPVVAAGLFVLRLARTRRRSRS